MSNIGNPLMKVPWNMESCLTYIFNHTEHNHRGFLHISHELICIPAWGKRSDVWDQTLNCCIIYKSRKVKKHNAYLAIPVWGSPVFASMFPSKPLILAVSSSWWQLAAHSGYFRVNTFLYALMSLNMSTFLWSRNMTYLWPDNVAWLHSILSLNSSVKDNIILGSVEWKDICHSKESVNINHSNFNSTGLIIICLLYTSPSPRD